MSLSLHVFTKMTRAVRICSFFLQRKLSLRRVAGSNPQYC